MQPWKLVNDTAQFATTDNGDGENNGIDFAGQKVVNVLQNTAAGGTVVADSGFASTAHPKLKFNFTVEFSFRGSIVGASSMEKLDLPVKTASRPTQNIALTDVNYYNYRTKVATRVENGTGTIVMYDDADGRAHSIYTRYMNALNPISRKVIIDDPKNIPFGELSSLGALPGNPNGIFDSISVYHFYVNKGRVFRTEYRYINPQVEQFELDELNMTESDVNTISLTFSYSGVVTTTTEV